MKIKLTREMIKRCYDGANRKRFHYYIDNDHIYLMPDGACMFVIESSDEWNDMLTGMDNVEPDDRLLSLKLKIHATSDIILDKFKGDSFVKMGTYWKLWANDDSFLFDDKYLKYFIKKNLTYDLFISGSMFGLIIYEGNSDDGYSIVGLLMGVKNG